MFNQIKKISTFVLAAGMFSTALVSCKKDKTEDSGSGGNASLSIISKVNQDPELSYIKNALGIAGLADTLSKSGAKFTFFAPVNATLDSLTYQGVKYSKLLTDTVNGYSVNTTREELRYHIVKGTYRSGDIPAGTKNLKVFTINIPEDSLFVTKATNNSIYVNGVKVDDAKKDITVGNGVIHKLVHNKATEEYGYLELPSSKNVYDLIKTTPGLDSLAKMIDRAASFDATLIPALKNNIVTVAAPVNSELSKLIQAFGGNINNISPAVIASVLKNHVMLSREFLINLAIATSSPDAGVPTLSGKKLGYTIAKFDAFGGAQLPAFYILKDKPVPLLASDFMCKNGVVHLIYGVILDK
ncbi:MAG: fasciclin domain-containing protein [Bacteroidetes bacterium]|nr:fasciclin domain-containing protein [Bacteroidota bacterium]